MVRTIDGPQRRHDLATAVWAIIRRDGFESASVRAVADEAGLSTGSVRHFFGTQDELHVFAMEDLIRVVTDRVAAAAAQEARTATDRVLAVLDEVLPFTPETTELYRAHLQFVTRSTVSPSLAPVARRTFDELQGLYRSLLGMLIEAGAAPPRLDVDRTADELAALLDGIVLRRLVVPHLLSVERGRELVAGFVAGLVGRDGLAAQDGLAGRAEGDAS